MGMNSNQGDRSKLFGPENVAVLEAQRAKLAALQKQQDLDNVKVSEARERGGLEGESPFLRVNNPVYGDDVGSVTPQTVQFMRDDVKKSVRETSVAGMGRFAVADLFVEPEGGGSARESAVGVSKGNPSASGRGQGKEYQRVRSYDFMKKCVEQKAVGPSLRVLPPQMQESLLIEDVLYSYGGYQGNWVKMSFVLDGIGRPDLEVSLECEEDVDPSIQEMVMRMLPLSRYVMIVRQFFETRIAGPMGLVNQALAGAMRGLLLDWELMLAQIENQMRHGKAGFTLQALWYYIQSPLSAFQLVAKIASDASSRKLKGASLLSYLHKRSQEVIGDPMASRFMLRILRATTEPYFAMLERWMCDAIIDDPYGEFVIQENTRISKGDLKTEKASSYWTDKFTLKKNGDDVEIPSFLAECAEAILETGKCIDLVKSCSLCPDRPLPMGVRIEYDEEGKYLQKIYDARKSAASAAVRTMHEHGNVLQGLETLKKYFLTSQGDLFLGFMDLAEIDLKNTNISIKQLHNVMQLAIQSCSAALDPAASHLEVVYCSKSRQEMMLELTRNSKAADLSPEMRPKLRSIHSMSVPASEKSKVPARSLLMLYYQVPWPLVVVAPDSVIAQYQAFFKHLFDLKWVDRELNRTYKLYQATKSLASLERGTARRLSVSKGALKSEMTAMKNLMLAYQTSQAMGQFFRQYLLYSSFELLDPLWKSLEDKIRDSRSIDEMVLHHSNFLEKAMRGLFLSRKLKLPPALFKVEELALEFVELSFRYLDIDYSALERAAENSVQLDNLKGVQAEAAKRKYRARRIRAEVNAALTNPRYEAELRELASNFKVRCKDFLSLLVDAYQDAKRTKQGSREELECLSNLIERLDFNGYFKQRMEVSL